MTFLNLLLKSYACTVADWQGSSYVLSTYTGKTEIASDLAELWQKVELLTGIRPDPLTLGQAHGATFMRHGGG